MGLEVGDPWFSCPDCIYHEEQASPSPAYAPRKEDKPDEPNQEPAKPEYSMIESVDACSLYEYVERQSVRHLRVVKLRKPKWCLAEFAVLLVGMGKPFHETVLVNELDASVAFTRVEKRLFCSTFATADSTCIPLFIRPH